MSKLYCAIETELLEQFLLNFVGDDVHLNVTRKSDGEIQIVTDDDPDDPIVLGHTLGASNTYNTKTPLGDLQVSVWTEQDPDNGTELSVEFRATGTDTPIDLVLARAPGSSHLAQSDAVAIYPYTDPFSEDYSESDAFYISRKDVLEAIGCDCQKENIVVDRETAAQIERYLHPTSPDDVLAEDATISFTVRFEDGFEADLKVCGVQSREGEDNSAWTEMVLFHNGCEVACSEPMTDLFGAWNLEHNGITYCVNIEKEL